MDHHKPIPLSNAHNWQQQRVGCKGAKRLKANGARSDTPVRSARNDQVPVIRPRSWLSRTMMQRGDGDQRGKHNSSSLGVAPQWARGVTRRAAEVCGHQPPGSSDAPAEVGLSGARSPSGGGKPPAAGECVAYVVAGAAGVLPRGPWVGGGIVSVGWVAR